MKIKRKRSELTEKKNKMKLRTNVENNVREKRKR